MLGGVLEKFDFEKEFPTTAKWHNAILQRPAIKQAWGERTEIFDRVKDKIAANAPVFDEKFQR